MYLRPPLSTLTDTLFPYTTFCRSERPALTATILPSADSDFSRGAGSAVPGVVPGGLSRLDLALIGGLVLLSVALLFWATRDPVLAGGFLAGLSVAAGGLLLVRRLFPAASGEVAAPDWTMLRQAIAPAGVAVAATDRAGRQNGRETGRERVGQDV